MVEAPVTYQRLIPLILCRKVVAKQWDMMLLLLLCHNIKRGNQPGGVFLPFGHIIRRKYIEKRTTDDLLAHNVGGLLIGFVAGKNRKFRRIRLQDQNRAWNGFKY